MGARGMSREERIQQARQAGYGRREAIALSSGLLRELEDYLVRRQGRKRHTDFDDFLDAHLPGLALALQLLADEGAEVQQVDLGERWPGVHADMVDLLGQLAATFGLLYADRVATALRKEVDRRLEFLANERTNLVLEIMEWAQAQQWPRFRGDQFDVQEGLDVWGTFCGDAPIGHLRTIRLRQRATEGRRRLEQLSEE